MFKTDSVYLKKGPSPVLFWCTALAISVGLILSVLSWLELCVEHCSANENYRLFGLPFPFIGIPFFSLILLGHLLSRSYPTFSKWIGLMILSALGAEVVFLYVQQYQIGRFCPVCLSIFLSLLVAGLLYSANYVKSLISTIQTGNRGDIMKKIMGGLTSIPCFFLGLFLAFIGVTKFDVVEAAEIEIKNKMTFGTQGSPVEVYFISDWFCPSCRKLEFMIEQLLPKIQKDVAFYFIDYPIHQKSLNFTPYNISFMINDKPKYFKARHLLFELTENTDSPKDADVKKAAEEVGVTYQDISFVEVKTGSDFFDNVFKKYKLSSTPAVVITNPKKNKTIKLEGTSEINQEKILNAITTLKKAK
jgi:hypothetical protein